MQTVKEIDRIKVLMILNELRLKVGHEAIKLIYHANRQLRKLQIVSFPIATLYKLSLYFKLKDDPEFAKQTTEEIAESEGISRRTAYRLRERYWGKKFDFEDLLSKGQSETKGKN
jgi:hypothetical protein